MSEAGGARLSNAAGGYRLHVAETECNAMLFASLSAEGRQALQEDRPVRAADRLARALALWRGPPLEDLTDLDWFGPEAARLTEARLAATEDRSDRVLRRPAPQRLPGTIGRPPRHGGEFAFGDPGSWGEPDTNTTTDTRLYGTATARAWNRLHPRLTHRTAWLQHAGVLPVIEGTVILLTVDRLPSDATAKPVWLWWSQPAASTTETDLCWQAFLRRFDIEHTFRMLKQTLGWTSPKLRDPIAGDRWTWLLLAAYAQLRLARGAVADLRRPWERPIPPERLTPARVRRGFRHLHGKAGNPATAPKPSRPGPGRPPGRRNRHPAKRHDVHIVTSATPASSTKKIDEINYAKAASHRLKTKLGADSRRFLAQACPSPT